MPELVRVYIIYVSDCRPASLDAFVFGYLAPLDKANLPSSPLQSHLRQLDNLTRLCDTILAVYFSSDHPCKILLHTLEILLGVYFGKINTQI